MDEDFDYSLITESPGLQATQEQLERLYQRYHFTRQYAKDKDVLEIACGCGLGLGYIAQVAKSVLGGDIDEKNYSSARKWYRGRSNINVRLMDAHNLNIPDKSFDLIVFFESIYYLKEPEKFISEADRVLRDNAMLIICTVNKNWADFHPSPYTYCYFSVPELYEIMEKRFKTVEMFGGFPIDTNGMKNKIVSLIKRTAVSYNLIPGSLKARSYLKRAFIGKLVTLPNEVYEDMSQYNPPLPIAVDQINKDYKIIYAVAKK